MKTGDQMVKPKSDKQNWKEAAERIRMLRFAVTKHLHDNYGEKEFKQYIRMENDLTEQIALGGIKKVLVDAVSKLSKPFLMKELVKNAIDGFQYEIPAKYYIVEEHKDHTTMEIKKCSVRRQFNKWAKKFAPELKDKICDWDIIAGEKIREYGIDQTIELTEKGCIFHYKILKNE